MNFINGIALVSLISFLVLFVDSSAIKRAEERQCGPNRLCKFGGRCTEEGRCVCTFDCSLKFWPPEKIYCSPKKDGLRRKYYLNLCQVLAHACEIQSDIPVVPFDVKRMECGDDAPPVERLCPDPRDHMGPCGGTLDLEGNLGAGVCLRKTKNNQRRCQCPSNKEGEDCYTSLSYVSSDQQTIFSSAKPNSDSDVRYIFYIVLCASVTVSIVAITIYLFIRNRTHNQTRTTCCTKPPIDTSFSGKDENADMAFNKFSKYSNSKTKENQSLCSSDRNDFSLKDSDLSSSDSDHFRRARLSGESLNVVPSLVAKSSNNLSKAADEKFSNNNNNNKTYSKTHVDIV